MRSNLTRRRRRQATTRANTLTTIDPKPCTILFCGASEDILNEIDCNLADAMNRCAQRRFQPNACTGGVTEVAISVNLQAKTRTVVGIEGWPYRAVADAREVIPRTLAQNIGGNTIWVLTLRVTVICISGKARERRTFLGSQWGDW
jgi:chaperonin GroEL (HSP60 family)